MASSSSSSNNAALQFYDALVNNDLATLKRVVDVHRIDLTSKFVQVRKRNHADLFPVHLVTYKGYLPLLHYLIEAGVDVDQTTTTLHRQAVHFAALKHQLPCLKRLIISGANIDAKDTFGNTPLHYAAEDGSVFLMTLLMQESANLDAQDITNKTPLMKATRNGKINAVKRLLAAGCSVNLKDKNDDTALHYTARYGSVEMTNMLLKAGAKIDAQNQWGLTPLMEAVSYNQMEVVTLLTRNNCDLYKRDFRTGDTALHIAVKKNYIDIARILMAAGKWYIEYNFNNFGESFLHDAIVYNRSELLRLFITYNYNLDYPAKKLPGVPERWPFQLAVDRGHWDMARVLSRVSCISCKSGVVLKKYSDLEEVKSLKLWARKVIRKQLGFNAEDKINQLPVPTRLKNYLKLDDIDWESSKVFP